MAELADALDLGSSTFSVWVRIPSATLLNIRKYYIMNKAGYSKPHETEEEIKERMRRDLKREMDKYERDSALGLVDDYGYIRAHSRY